MLNLSTLVFSPEGFVSKTKVVAGFLASCEYKSLASSIFPSTFIKFATSVIHT